MPTFEELNGGNYFVVWCFQLEKTCTKRRLEESAGVGQTTVIVVLVFTAIRLSECQLQDSYQSVLFNKRNKKSFYLKNCKHDFLKTICFEKFKHKKKGQSDKKDE